MLGALFRGVARGLQERAWPNRIVAQGDHLGLARPDHVPQREVRAVLRDAAGRRRSATTTRRRRAVAAGRDDGATWSACHPMNCSGADTSRRPTPSGMGHTAGQLRRHLAPARPAARRQGPGAAAGARRRVDDRHAPPAGLSTAQPPRRTRLGVRVDRLPGQPAYTPGPTTSSTSSARWPGSRSTSPNTAATPTSWRSPAARRAATSARWPR